MSEHALRILITGGAGGIGQALVRMLRRNGHIIAVADRTEPREADCYVRCDLSEIESADNIIEEAQRALGGIDALVLGAARYDASNFESCTLENFRDVIRVNLESPLALVKAWAAGRGAQSTSATVVLIASAAAHVGSRDPGYASSKAGLLGLSRSLALNLTPRGIRVFSVSPGVVDTAMSFAQGEERRDEHVKRTLLGRSAHPEEVAETIRWLLESAPEYMSGGDINISNGIHW